VKNALISMINFAKNYYRERKRYYAKKLGTMDKRQSPDQYAAYEQLLTTYGGRFTVLTQLLKSVTKLNNSPIEALLD
jgi:hypothetical protein